MVKESEIFDHIDGSDLTEEGIALEENQNNFEVPHRVFDLGSNRGESGKHHQEEQCQVDCRLEAHGRWVIREVFPYFVVIGLKLLVVKVVICGVDEHVFHLGKHDSWTEPSHELVEEQKWKVYQHLQSLDNTVSLAVESKDVVEVQQGCELTKQETIGPSSSLLHQQLQRMWCICVTWCIDDEISAVACSWLIVHIVG